VPATLTCGANGADRNQGVEDLVVFSSTEIGALLSRAGGLWALLAIGALGVITYEVTQLCGSDPPAQPTISSAEYQALLELGPPDLFTSALAKLKDIVTIEAWFQLCHCVSGGTPPIPAGTLTPPAGVTITDFNTGPCADINSLFNHVGSLPGSDPSNDMTQQLFPQLQFVQSSASNANWPVRPIARVPSTWVSFHESLQWVSGSDPQDLGFPVALDFYDQNQVLSGLSFVLNSNQLNPYHRFPASGDQAISGAAMSYFSVVKSGQPTGGTAGVTNYQLVTNCSGQPIPTLSCSTDPVLMTMLGQILQQVNLIQRQNVPFAYIFSTPHSGLTGTGEFAVQGLIGVRVNVISSPPGAGSTLGHPDQIWNAGWINWGNVDGFAHREWIDNALLVSFPNAAGQYTRLGFSISPGFTVDITELKREA